MFCIRNWRKDLSLFIVLLYFPRKKRDFMISDVMITLLVYRVVESDVKMADTHIVHVVLY